MTKLTKLSLATTVALVGISSTAFGADNVADKVKFKGEISYTMEKYSDKDGKDDEAQHDIDVRVQADFAINDKFSATLRLDEANDDDTDKNPNDADSTAKDSSPIDVEIDQVYMTYKNGDLKVTGGLQKVLASKLHDSLNGDGLIVDYKMSDMAKFTVGQFYSTEAKTTTDEIFGLGLEGKASIINYGATYATIKDSDTANGNDGTATDNGAKAIDLLAGITLGDMKIDFSHTTKSYDATTRATAIKDSIFTGTLKDQKLTKIALNGKVSDIKYNVSYTMTGTDGGQVALDDDYEAPVFTRVENLSTINFKDATALGFGIDSKLVDQWSIKADYLAIDSDNSTDSKWYKEGKETLLTLNYAAEKNFNIFAKYDIWDITKSDGTSKEDRKQYILGAKYTF